LSDSLTKQDIESYFGEFGKIVEIELFKAEGTH
jgi:RNA recognition motif-containing protein